MPQPAPRRAPTYLGAIPASSPAAGLPMRAARAPERSACPSANPYLLSTAVTSLAQAAERKLSQVMLEGGDLPWAPAPSSSTSTGVGRATGRRGKERTGGGENREGWRSARERTGEGGRQRQEGRQRWSGGGEKWGQLSAPHRVFLTLTLAGAVFVHFLACGFLLSPSPPDNLSVPLLLDSCLGFWTFLPPVWPCPAE